MAEKKPKIIVIKEDFTADGVAEESVSSVVKSAKIMDAVDTMATDFKPDNKTVLTNPEFGLVFSNLTDSEEKELAKKPGIEAIEDDVPVTAFNEDLDDLGAFDDEILENDDEASRAIDEAFAEPADPDMYEVTPEEAQLAAQSSPVFSDVEIDETGSIIEIDAELKDRVEAAGIPKEKLMAIVKCVIKCAIEQFAGNIKDVSDEKIGELLSGLDLAGDSESVSAIRDYITCGLKIIYAPQAWRYSTGAGVRVAVVDTGITPRHPDLRVYGGVSFVPGVTRWYDDNGHGTHVAGTIAALANHRGVIGVAPAARLYAVKVLNRNGSGSTSSVINGLTWCYRTGMHVVNLSLGSGATSHSLSDYSRAYETVGRRLRARGILAVAAAGNSGGTSRPYVGNPARCPSFMAVSSIDCSRRRSSFSSYGPQVEICGPGTNVISTYPPNGYRRLSGTSMATPHVAGVAALVKRRRPSWTGNIIRWYLWRTALDLGRPGRDWFFGYGQVRAYHAVR